MLARLEGGQRHRQVQVVGDGQADRLDVVAGEQVLVVAIDGRDIELGRKLLAAVGVQSGQGDDFRAGILRIAFEVKNAGAAADDADAEPFSRLLYR